MWITWRKGSLAAASNRTRTSDAVVQLSRQVPSSFERSTGKPASYSSTETYEASYLASEEEEEEEEPKRKRERRANGVDYSRGPPRRRSAGRQWRRGRAACLERLGGGRASASPDPPPERGSITTNRRKTRQKLRECLQVGRRQQRRCADAAEESHALGRAASKKEGRSWDWESGLGQQRALQGRPQGSSSSARAALRIAPLLMDKYFKQSYIFIELKHLRTQPSFSIHLVVCKSGAKGEEGTRCCRASLNLIHKKNK